jgi:signal transduction histidine kinase
LLLRSPRIFQGPQTNRDAHHRLKVELPQKILFHAITTNYRKDGTPYVVDWNIAPVCDQAGKITHYVSVQRDITQQQAMEKRLTMSSKMESVGSLAAGIAHEINSPAQFIGDNVQFAYDAICKASGRLREAGTALPPKIAQPLFEEVPFALKDALEGLSRIDKIVKSMREFAHPGEEMGPVDINRCLETSVTVCRNEWKHVATVDFQLDPDLPPILCVRSDVNQVVVNLVVNAAHAIAGQKREGLGRILLSTRVHEGWAELQVEDDGPGVPPEIQEKIFDPFFTTKPVGQGTGQGLFLAQQSIVIKHHGRISITNLPAGGAAFLIQLPLHR